MRFGSHHMFASVGRRLALLNALSVLVVIALVGGATYFILRTTLSREADDSLRERARSARITWSELFNPDFPRVTATAAIPSSEDDESNDQGDKSDDNESHDDDEDSDDDFEVIEAGDTLLYAFDREGSLIADARGISVAGLPLLESVHAALDGRSVIRNVQIDAQTVRVYTEPVWADGEIVGVIQAAQGQSMHEAELRLVQIASLAGIALGALISIPSGMFLARRAMRPISVAFDRQRAFVADASHELRTPLTVIRANAELVKRLPAPPAKVQSEMDYILSEVDCMARLVDDLLLLARLDDSSLLLEREEHELDEILKSVLDPMQAFVAEKKLTLTFHQLDRPAVACIDPVRIRQVLRILIDNAVKYTSSGGAIQVNLEHHPGRVTVKVSDTGIGIAAEDQVNVFERFYRADADRSRESGGSGLGLTIARALVVAHGGSIGIDSRVGHGTTIWFSVSASC